MANDHAKQHNDKTKQYTDGDKVIQSYYSVKHNENPYVIWLKVDVLIQKSKRAYLDLEESIFKSFLRLFRILCSGYSLIDCSGDICWMG